MTITHSIELHGVDVSYRKREVLKAVSHRFENGCHLIEGVNGVGKSTLVGAIAGHVPYRGSIRIQGKDLHKDPVSARRHLAYVPDAPVFHPFVTGREFIEFLMKSHGLTWSNHKVRFDNLVQRFGLEPHLASRFSEASLGTRRKFFLVAMFVIYPSALLLDEPFNGLDKAASAELADLLKTASIDRVVILTCHQRLILDTLTVTRWTLGGHPHASLFMSGDDPGME